MAAAEPSPEQRELSLVGKVEMRIALADTDAKLESSLKTYLAPLLLKLASDHQSVRNKVITICQHINTRVKPESIQLPVAALIKQFKDQQSSLIRHFDLLYIQQGVDRLKLSEKSTLLPVVISGIAKSDSHGPTIFNLLLRLLETFQLPPRGDKADIELRTKHEVSNEDAEYLAFWLGRFLLFTPQKVTTQPCPGLTPEEYAYFTVQGKPGVWDPAQGGMNLLRTKVLAARLLASGLFNEQERFLPALFASADTASTISDIGDDMMKRTLPATDLEDEQLVHKLFSLYFGEGQAPRVRPPLRVKILGLLGKSNKSTTFSNKIMSLVEDGVAPPESDGEDTTMSGMPSTNRTSIGREATKLRSAVFSYVNFVARYGGEDTLHAIAPRVVSRLRDFIENQGWPKVGGNEDLVSRGYAYEVIGLLAKAGPRELLVETEGTNLDLLRYLFSSLAQDTSGGAIIVSIEEALSTLLSAIARLTLTASEQSVLEDLLIEEMELSSDLEANKRLRSTRYVAVRFANRCLPFNSVKARWVDVLGIGARGERMELREEAERGLSPYWYRMLNGSSAISGVDTVPFPAFNTVIEEFFTGRTIDSDEEAMAVARDANKLRKHCFAHMTAFARRILFNEALVAAGNPPNMDHEWERRLDAAAESDEKARQAIKKHIVTVGEEHSQALAILECALFEGVAADPSAPQDHLVEFLSLASNKLVQKLTPAVDQLLPSVLSNHHNARIAASHAYAIIASHPSANSTSVNSQLAQLLEKATAWEVAIGAQANQIHGAVVTLGFFFGRAYYRDPTNFKDNELYQKFLPLLMQLITSAKDALIKEASFIALGQLCMFGAFVPQQDTVREAIDKVYEVAKTGNEQATLCLGQISMVLDESEKDDDKAGNLAYVISQLHKLHEVRQAEVHFGVGEAFSYVASGWKSSALAAKLDIEGPMPIGPKREKTLEKLADRFIGDCGQTKPSLKKAAAMWLLCLVQFCGEEQEIQGRLGPIQIAFKRCLTDRDELVQETASRGLGLVYEKGDRSLKDDLVRDLVSSFSSDKTTGLAGTVSADTQLFEPGALPTGDGSVSTYKDIMSLASEVGDSSLVYRFMSMASSNAIWSSRAAFGRFGLSNVLSDSSVDGYLAENPKLYPKLFRYRFDPNQGVQRSMNDIWNALVKDSSATIEKHFDAIIEDLLASILGKEWRTRQASCAAIADLVSGRPMEKYEPYLERIWNSCFKVLDDIKDSVRVAAASLARTLTGILTRALEADHSSTKTASSMLKHVLPFLLSPSGMESSAQEVQAFAVRTLLEIVKKSNGQTLRPFIPELVERLVGLLSSLEPEAVNYIHLNASKYNLTEQKIDDMRLSSVRSSPIMEAIERCLDLVDDETMLALQPRLANGMKSAVGLPSKVGSSRILVSLSTRRMAVFKPVADDFLKLIEKLVLDRNETVASSYAAAAGYVARHASDKQILRMVGFARGLYFDSEHDREGRSLTAAELILAFAKQASDRFNSLAASILPFVFVGKHDSHSAVKEQFQNTWEEAVGGSRAVLLYLKEILELSGTHLDSAQWTLKHTAARTVADSVMAVSASEGQQISVDATKLLWPALEKALGGKTWEGKEVVLTAFVKFVQSAKGWYLKDSAVAAAIVKIAVREAKRQNPAYRPHAVKALAEIALARRDIDLHETVLGVIKPLIDEDVEASEGDPMDVDGKKEDGDKAAGSAETRDSTMSSAISALFASINPEEAATKTSPSALRAQILTSLTQALRLRNPNVALQRAVYKGVADLFGDLAKAQVGEEAVAVAGGGGGEVAAALKEHLFRADAGSEANRLLRADAVVAVFAFSKALGEELREGTLSLAKEDPSSAVRGRLTSAVKGL